MGPLRITLRRGERCVYLGGFSRIENYHCSYPLYFIQKGKKKFYGGGDENRCIGLKKKWGIYCMAATLMIRSVIK